VPHICSTTIATLITAKVAIPAKLNSRDIQSTPQRLVKTTDLPFISPQG
jgi:hypothetical protein